MYKDLAQLIKAVLVLIIFYQIIGCTIIAPKIGSLIDGSDKNLSNEKLEKLTEEKTGKRIVIAKKDHTIISGKLDTVKSLPDSIYSQNILRFNTDGNSPELNESLIIKLADNTEVRGEFSGFNYFSKYTQKKRESDFTFREMKIGEFVPVECRLLNNNKNGIPLNQISTIVSVNGKEYNSDVLRQFAIEQSLPINSMISLTVDSTKTQIPIGEINYVNIKKGDFWKKVGLGVGIAVDVAIVTIGVAFLAIWLDGSMMENSNF